MFMNSRLNILLKGVLVLLLAGLLGGCSTTGQTGALGNSTQPMRGSSYNDTHSDIQEQLNTMGK